MDGGFVLEQDDRKRKLFKKTRIERKAAKVYASESIQASASSGADIECKGMPKNVNIEKSSGGSVKVEE